MEAVTKPQTKITFKTIRVTILLIVLGFVGIDSWLTKQRTTDWDSTLWVALYPINGDGSTQSETYIQSLQEKDFIDIEQFMDREAKRY